MSEFPDYETLPEWDIEKSDLTEDQWRLWPPVEKADQPVHVVECLVGVEPLLEWLKREMPERF